MAHRRYKIGINPVYDDMYDRYRLESPVLNPGRAKPSVYTPNLSDRKGLQTALLQYQEYKESAEEQLLDVKAKFEAHKQKTINEGRPAPKQMPPELVEDELKIQAKLDVIKDELQEIEKRLKAFEDQDKQVSDAKVLKGGPKGASQIKNGIVVEIDGQAVVADQDGVLRIQDSRSRYDGLETARYFEEVVQPWKAESRKLLREYERKVKNGEINPRETPKPRAPWPKKPEESKEKKSA